MDLRGGPGQPAAAKEVCFACCFRSCCASVRQKPLEVRALWGLSIPRAQVGTPRAEQYPRRTWMPFSSSRLRSMR